MGRIRDEEDTKTDVCVFNQILRWMLDRRFVEPTPACRGPFDKTAYYQSPHIFRFGVVHGQQRTRRCIEKMDRQGLRREAMDPKER